MSNEDNLVTVRIPHTCKDDYKTEPCIACSYLKAWEERDVK